MSINRLSSHTANQSEKGKIMDFVCESFEGLPWLWIYILNYSYTKEQYFARSTPPLTFFTVRDFVSFTLVCVVWEQSVEILWKKSYFEGKNLKINIGFLDSSAVSCKSLKNNFE